MLYIFYVNTGTMLTFDMNLAMETVSNLQLAIQRGCHIPEDKQVLLISGGENLNPTARVCSYAAGTDTNPIFLFSKSSIEAVNPPSPSVNYGSEHDLREQVEGSLNMPPTYETVVARAQLARQMEEVAREHLKACEHLVHDQHMQHQGWAAVIANLEDITSAFRTRSEIFQQNFADYLTSRESMQTALSSFTETCQLLSKIPLLPCLHTSRLDTSRPDTSRSDTSQQDTSSQSSQPLGRTLLDWISAQDSKNSLEQMAEQCQAGLQQFDKQVQEILGTEIQDMLEKVNNPNMKEVKGLEDRLYGLEQLMHGARKVVQEQADMAQGFIANQNRASNVRDATVLPDLCSSHRRQLEVLLKNQQTLHDIKRRCTLAKEELSANLHARLRWVMYVEKQICDVDSKLVIYHENLKKLRHRLEIIQQIHQTPDLYARAVVEAVRRQQFSQQFTEWASSLAEDWQQVHREEIQRRAQFSSDLSHHFLQALFQGFEDQPPAFATEPPASFDTDLPSISVEDIHRLQQDVPELADRLRVPSTDFLSHFKLKLCRGASSGTIVLHKSVSGHSHESEEISEKQAGSKTTEPETADVDAQHAQGKMSEIIDPDLSQSVEVLTTEDVQHATGAPSSLQRKGTPSQTPEAEDTSDGFTTADFYIDESMPSSVNESPPHKKVQEMQQVVAEKAAQIEQLEKEKEDLHGKLQAVSEHLQLTEEKCRKLHEMVQLFVQQIRTDYHTVQSQVIQEKEKFRKEIEQVMEQLAAVLNNFSQHQDSLKTSELENLRTQLTADLEKVQAQLEVEMGKYEDAQRQVEIYCGQLSEISEECANLRHDLDSKALEYEEKLSKNTLDLTNKLVLEHEVELEKVQSEFKLRLEEQEEQISQFKNSLYKKESLYMELCNEKETAETRIRELTKDMEEIKHKMKEEFNAERESLETELRETLESECSQKIQDMNREKDNAIQAACDKLQQELKAQFDETLETHTKELKSSHENHTKELSEQLEKEKIEALDNLRKEISDNYESDIARISTELEKERESRREFENQQKECSIPVDQHDEKVKEMEAKLLAEKEKEIAMALKDFQVRHDADISALIDRFEKDKQESLNAMRASMTADKQVMFNEAVNRVTAEKDKVIEEMKKREASLVQQQQKDREMIDKLLSVESHSSSTRLADLDQAAMAASVVPIQLTESSVDAVVPDRITQLESSLKSQEEENRRLSDKLMQLSMTTSSRGLVQEKVSITTCNVGDIVLLCLDERHEQYVVFSVGPTLHFLHTDCLELLGLKSGPEESKKSWVLAEVTDKEYCQAKKAQNRFKVPMGTKFYRVKAKPWKWDGGHETASL